MYSIPTPLLNVVVVLSTLPVWHAPLNAPDCHAGVRRAFTWPTQHPHLLTRSSPCMDQEQSSEWPQLGQRELI
jgi:hypothetical protein